MFDIIPVPFSPGHRECIEAICSLCKILRYRSRIPGFRSGIKNSARQILSSWRRDLLGRNSNGVAVGCVVVRPLDPPFTCETKILYVSPTGRGSGLVINLVRATLEKARSLGYSEIKLDTLSTMKQAIDLYTKAGFVRTPPHYGAPFLVQQLHQYAYYEHHDWTR